MFAYDVTVYSVIALLLAVILAVIGSVQIAGPSFARQAYKNWNYPQLVRLVTGVLDIVAALMLALPAFRGFGIALAGILTFGSIVIFLSHQQYRYALPTMALMAALVPATVAVPRSSQVQFTTRDQVAPLSRAVAAPRLAESSRPSIIDQYYYD